MQRLKEWLAGYRLPDPQQPLYAVELANLDILRSFYALLALTGQQRDPVAAVREHISDFAAFPLSGLPSEALIVLGVARPTGPLADLQQRLLAGLSAQQAAEYLQACEESLP